MDPNRWPNVDTSIFETVPFLERLVCELRERQRHPSEAFGRWDQLDLLTHGYFEVPSIWTDRTLRSAGVERYPFRVKKSEEVGGRGGVSNRNRFSKGTVQPHLCATQRNGPFSLAFATKF